MNLFELFVKIGVDDQASKNIANITQKLGNGLKTAAKIGTAAVGVAATGITALTTAAVKNYAEYEQLVGGVETLFKESSDKLMEYANKAYMAQGVSANEYMSLATSFSASLLQSLEGDTDAAVEATNLAITDMSDNANKMGTDIEMLKNAYQGFAKENYTMLDNLKLGYGGTKNEMQRLLLDAEEIAGLEPFSLHGFDGIVQAIHIIQTEMGITGTTADEAGRTISGSVNAMKAAWTNLITGIANDNADFSTLVDDFVTTLVGDGSDTNLGVIGNILPRIEVAINGVGDLIEGLAPVIVEKLPSLVSTVLPKLLSAATSVVESVASVFPDLVDTVAEILTSDDTVKSFLGIITSIINAILDASPDIVDAILEVLPTVIEELGNSIGDILPNLIEAVVKIVQSLANNIGTIIQSLVKAIPTIIESLNKALKENFPALLQGVVTLVLEIVRNLPDIIKMLTDQIGPIVSTIVSVIVSNLPAFIAGIVQIVFEIVKALPEILASIGNSVFEIFRGFGNGLVDAAPAFIEGMNEIWTAIGNWLLERWTDFTDWVISIWNKIVEVGKYIISGIYEGFLAGWKIVTDWFNDVWQSLVSWFENLWEDAVAFGTDIVNAISEGLSDAWESVTEWFSDSWDDLTTWFSDLWEDFVGIGEDIVNGIWEGITNVWTDLTDWFTEAWDGLVGGVKDFLGIHSPSTVFAEIGKFVDLGLVEGLKAYSDLAVGAMEDLSDDVYNAFDGDYDMEYAVGTVAEPYEGESFEDSLTSALRALVSVEENRAIDVNISIDAEDSEMGRMLLNLLNVTATEVYA